MSQQCRKQVLVLEDRECSSPLPCKVSLWSCGFFLTIPGWLQLTSAGSFGRNFLVFALGCQVLAVPCFFMSLQYCSLAYHSTQYPKPHSNRGIALYPFSLASHKKFLVCTEEAALFIIQSNNRAAEGAESPAPQPWCSHPCWQELTRRRMRERRNFLQVGDVCVPAVFGLQSARTPACEMWVMCWQLVNVAG